MPISCPQTPCQQVAFPNRDTQPLSFQPAQSTGPAKLRKTSQCAPLHPSVDLRLLSSHPNWEKPFTFPILFQSGAAVSMATFRSPPLHLPLPKLDRGSYCLSVGLTKTSPLHCRGWTGVPNLEPLHAEFLFLQLPTRSADLLLQSPLLLRTHDPELRAGPVPPFARLLGAPGPPGPPGASSRGRGPQSADSAAGGAGRSGAGPGGRALMLRRPGHAQWWSADGGMGRGLEWGLGFGASKMG